MRRALIAIGALLAAAGIGALATGLAGGDPAPPPFRIDPDRELGPIPVERVEEPPTEARRASDRGAGGGKEQLEFFQTEPIEVAPQTEEGRTLTCPKGYKAAGGYYRTGRAGTFLGLTAPQISDRPKPEPDEPPPSKRNWEITVFNTTVEADQVILGVSCLRKR